jgi:hypothetical protein
VLELLRSLTQRILGVPDFTAYVLTMPHPVYHDIAVYYQGYLLAKMATSQTREYLTRTLGYIVDNPAVGPLLTKHCWATGNSVTLDQTLRSLTGDGLTSAYLAAECNRSPEEAWRLAQAAMTRAVDDVASTGDLDASIAVVHGAQCVATNEESLEGMYRAFEAWVETV